MIKIKCSHCNGTGEAEMVGAIANTLTLLRAQTKPKTGKEMAKMTGIKNEAMCNRLVYLERLGLVQGVRNNLDGRERLWTAVPEKPCNGFVQTPRQAKAAKRFMSGK